MNYSIVVALAEDDVMGRDGDLPWRLSSDLKLFRQLTMGKPLIMGRKTFETLPGGALDGRDNIVVSRDVKFDGEGIIQALNIESACGAAETCAGMRLVDEAMVIGGAQIYASMLDKVSRIYLTRVKAKVEGDTYFPPIDWSEWEETHVKEHDAGPKDDFAFSFHKYERKKH